MPRKRSLEAEPGSPSVAVLDSPETLDTPAPLPTNQKPTLKSVRLTLPDYQRMSLREAMQKMTEDDWSDKMLYLYRSAPFTSNKHTGKRYGYILSTGFPGISEEEIERTFGGGQFRAYLKMGKYTCAEQLYSFPGKPKLKEDEIFTTPEVSQSASAPAAQTAGLDLNGVKDLIRMFLESQRQEREAVGDDEGASAINKSIELMSQASLKANELVANANKAPTLADQLAMVKQLMEIAAPKQDDTMKALLLKFLDRAMPAQGAPAANPMEQMKAAFETMKSAKEIFGEAEAAASGDWKSSLVAALVPAIPQVIQLIRVAAANRPPQVIVMQPGPDGRMHAVPQHATPPTLETVPIQPAAPASVEAPVVPAPVSAPSAFPAVSPDLLSGDALKLRVVTMFLKGKDGALVASFIEDVAPTVYNALRQVDASLFPNFLRNDPIFAQIANEPNFAEWCKEFLDYMHEEEEQEMPAEVAPAPVQ